MDGDGGNLLRKTLTLTYHSHPWQHQIGQMEAIRGCCENQFTYSLPLSLSLTLYQTYGQADEVITYLISFVFWWMTQEPDYLYKVVGSIFIKHPTGPITGGKFHRPFHTTLGWYQSKLCSTVWDNIEIKAMLRYIYEVFMSFRCSFQCLQTTWQSV